MRYIHVEESRRWRETKERLWSFEAPLDRERAWLVLIWFDSNMLFITTLVDEILLWSDRIETRGFPRTLIPLIVKFADLNQNWICKRNHWRTVWPMIDEFASRYDADLSPGWSEGIQTHGHPWPSILSLWGSRISYPNRIANEIMDGLFRRWSKSLPLGTMLVLLLKVKGDLTEYRLITFLALSFL